MKFKKYLPLGTREFLEKQYKEYIKETPMTKRATCLKRMGKRWP